MTTSSYKSILFSENDKDLLESENRLRAIFNTAGEGIITIDDHGMIELFNPAAEKIFGYTQKEVLGNNIKMLMAPPYRERHDKYIKHYLNSGKAKAKGIDREMIGQKKNGTTFPINVGVNYVQLGNQHFFVGIIRDITVHKRNEEQIKELSRQIITIQEEERSRIAKDMHDQLGQDLSALKIMITSILSKCKPLEKSHENPQHKALDYIDKIIERTRILSHSLSPIGLKNLGLTMAIKRLADTFSFIGSHLTIKLDLENIDPHFTDGWDTNVYRIVQETLTNITKHSGAKKITFSTQNTKDKLMIKIQDDGIGFLTKNDSNKKKGIGILIMRERAHLAGGSLSIYSEIGSGTEVEIAIPKR